MEYAAYDVKQVANWFLKKEPMMQKKLQKLCYYAYVWYLYFNNDIEEGFENLNVLFKNDIQGWVHGPVSYELYRAFPFKGMQTLTYAKGYGDIPESDAETNQFLQDIYDVFGRYTGNELEAMTHTEKPWKESRDGLSSYEPGMRLLKNRSMYEHCAELSNG